MNAFVLLLWLVLADGRQQILTTRYFSDPVACEQAGRAIVEQRAQRGERVVFKCHLTIPEYTGDDIDVNGNPITP